MPNSGAFRSLHCLIYKVLAPFRARCGTFTILPQVFRFVKYFFRLFSKSFFVLSFPNRLPLRQLAYFTRPFRVCQVLFSSFLKTFSGPAIFRVSALDSLLILADSNPFVKYFSRLFSNFFHPLAAHARFRVEKLCHFTARSSVCQAFFSTLSNLFFAAPCRTPVPSDSLCSIANAP